NAVDANWNLVSTNDTVAISSSATNATLPTNTVLVAGSRVFTNGVTFKTIGTATLTASDITHTGIASNTSPAITVNGGPGVKLAILTQPSSSAVAGVAFSQQPVIAIVDLGGNVSNTNNATVVIASRIAGNGILQGTTALTAINGIVTFTNLFHTVA